MKGKFKLLFVFLLFNILLIAGCRNHTVPTNPSLNTATITATAAGTTTTPTITITGTPPTATVTSTSTVISTSTATSVATAIATATTGSTGHGYRVKTVNAYINSVLQAVITYSYASGCTPTSLTENIYDSLGNITATAQATLDINGNTISATVYDSSNNIIGSMTSQTSGGLVTQVNQYDGARVLVAYVTYQYDSSNRVIREDDFDGSGTHQSTIFSEYYPGIQGSFRTTVSSNTPQSSITSLKTFDVLGRLTSIDVYMSGVKFMSETYQYNTAGLLSTVNELDGTGATSGTMNFAYNALGAITSVSMTLTNITMNGVFTYDGNNNLADETVTTTMMSTYTVVVKCTAAWESY